MRKLLVALLLVSSAVAFYVGYQVELQKTVAGQPEELTELVFENVSSPTVTPSLPASRTVRLRLPAVDKEGVGQTAELVVEVKNGKGRLFIGFDGSPLINPDTQSSLRVAFDVAKDIAGVATSGLDAYYSIITSSDEVGGKSAGAAAAVATIAALRNESLKPGVLITGAVNADGSIARVGKVLEKAKAVKQLGYAVFIVPDGEGTTTKEVENCSKAGECTSVLQEVSIADETGIKIIEAKTVIDAYNAIALKQRN